MIRRLFTLVWAVAGRSKTIQDLVAIVWPRSGAPVAVRAEASPEPVVVAEPPRLAPAGASAADALASVTDETPGEASVAPPPPVSVVAAVVEAVVEPVAQAIEAAVVASEASAVAAEAPVAEAVVAQAPAPVAAPPLRPLGQKEAMDGSVWVPRILWALEFAKLRELGPQSASDISRVLGEHSGLSVPSPNVARAFRDRKEQGASYWKEVDSQRYEISRAGSAALRKQLKSSEN
jgi:hypothetical protein